MPRVAPVIPSETDLLCEKCGYTLNGIPPDSRCPECGKPVVESADPPRAASAWELHPTHFGEFWMTTSTIILRPTHFYRTFLTRGGQPPALRFARIHWMIASLLFGVSADFHFNWFARIGTANGSIGPLWILPISFVIYVLLSRTTSVAARLTHWEASYRGLRLTSPVILRGLYFHAAHYLPVAAAVALTTGGYQLLLVLRVVGMESGSIYLYLLSGEIVLFAGYLFHTYWIGMRNMMYANK